MKAVFRFFPLFLFILVFSSCGVVTKARYGNGYKLNVGDWFSKEGDIAKTPKEKSSKPRTKIVGVSEYSSPNTTEALPTELANEPEILAKTEENQNTYPKALPAWNDQIEKDEVDVLTQQSTNQVLDEVVRHRVEEPDKPLEPISTLGAILFYGGSALSLVFEYLLFSYVLYQLLGLLITLGALFSLIGLVRHLANPGRFRGIAWPISVLVVVFIYIALALLILAIFIL